MVRILYERTYCGCSHNNNVTTTVRSRRQPTDTEIICQSMSLLDPISTYTKFNTVIWSKNGMRTIKRAIFSNSIWLWSLTCLGHPRCNNRIYSKTVYSITFLFSTTSYTFYCFVTVFLVNKIQSVLKYNLRNYHNIYKNWNSSI